MKRASVLVVVLAFSTWAVAQTTQSGANSAPANTQGTQTVVVPGALNTNTGPAMVIAPSSVPLAVTPELHLAPMITTVGATNATPGNTAGAVNATTDIAIPPRIITTVPQFTYAGASVTQTIPQFDNAGTSTTPPMAGATTASGTPIVVLGNNTMLFDRGVGSSSPLVAGSDTSGRSLGEIARENRQPAAGANAHVYTNDDINRINAQPGVTIGGISGAAVGAGNATQPQPSSNMPAVSRPAANPPVTPGVSQPVPPSNNPPQSEVNPRSPFAPPREMAQAKPPANPAAQRAQASSSAQTSPSGTQRDQRQLPSAGSILPLMALVGILAAGAGLLSR